MNFLKVTELKKEISAKILTLNRPEVKNAFHPDMIAEITYFFENQKNVSDADLLIVRGAGDIFCSGADLNWMRDMVKYSLQENLADSENLWKMFAAIQDCPTPVVSVVHGGVFGGALGLVACSDYVLSENGTKFCFSEVKLGLAPAVISDFISRKIPDSFYRPLMLSAEIFNSEQALKIGLIHRIFSNEVDDSDILNIFSKNGSEAMRETKKLLNKLMKTNEDLAKKQNCIRVISERRVSLEGQERLKKFL